MPKMRLLIERVVILRYVVKVSFPRRAGYIKTPQGVCSSLELLGDSWSYANKQTAQAAARRLNKGNHSNDTPNIPKAEVIEIE